MTKSILLSGVQILFLVNLCLAVFICGSLPDSLFFFSSRRRHTRSLCDWSSDVCSSDLATGRGREGLAVLAARGGATETQSTGVTRGGAGDSRDARSRRGKARRRRPARGPRCQGHGRGPGRSEERRVGKEWRWRVWEERG